MSEPLYTTDFLEEYFGTTKDHIHKICHEYNIKPVKKVERYGSPNGKNLYSEEQKDRLERILHAKAIKQANKVVYIESVYIYRESLMNNPDSIL